MTDLVANPSLPGGGAVLPPPAGVGAPWDAAAVEQVANDLFRSAFEPSAATPSVASAATAPSMPTAATSAATTQALPSAWAIAGRPAALATNRASPPIGASTDMPREPPLGVPTALPGAGYYFVDEATAQTPSLATPMGTLDLSHLELGEATAAQVPQLAPTPGLFDVQAVRRDFPILQERVHGKPLIWLDNAATTQKPLAVIERISSFYRHEYSNIHRAAHALAARSTEAYEAAREKARRFLNASSVRDIVFVRGATEGINLVAQSWGRRYIEKGDEIIITWLEHHSNIVPWQQLAAERGARLRVAPIDDRGQVRLDEFESLFSSRTRLVALTHVSNALGTVNPVKEMTAIAHRHGARVLVDGAQAVSHLPVDVQDLDVDYYVFSGHKVYGPSGIGVLFGRSELLDATPPWQGGGNMIVDVTFERTVYHAAPARFEAGTGNITDAVGLGAALDYVTRIGMPNVARHEHELLEYACAALQRLPKVTLVGNPTDRAGVVSFVLDGYRSEDVGAALDQEGIAVRSGHHCAQPTLRRLGHETTVRPSLGLYNTRSDIDAMVDVVGRL